MSTLTERERLVLARVASGVRPTRLATYERKTKRAMKRKLGATTDANAVYLALLTGEMDGTVREWER